MLIAITWITFAGIVTPVGLCRLAWPASAGDRARKPSGTPSSASVTGPNGLGMARPVAPTSAGRSTG